MIRYVNQILVHDRWWKMRSDYKCKAEMDDAVLNHNKCQWRDICWGRFPIVCVLFPSSISWQDQIHETRSCYDVWVQSDIYFDRFNASIRIGSPKLLPCGSCPGSFVVWAVFMIITYLHIINIIVYHICHRILCIRVLVGPSQTRTVALFHSNTTLSHPERPH